MNDRTGPAVTDVDDLAATRAEPLPEERAAQTPDEDRRAEAEAILRESEERVAGAAGGATPADAADEHRRSEETT
ncbi:hypothetical protein [Pseudonocardia acidicola]|uniref:Nucleotide exchange factor GrpE n=1 Tax=Pseudonocardia acidicola TaxID=2724939 RepID=A0ABX1SLI9_9PSEU|nr:hypothetical protein [Pseudonocardia acidicola]NMI01926.1 hypothetical protein [Pseudonocardia acidicola]